MDKVNRVCNGSKFSLRHIEHLLGNIQTGETCLWKNPGQSQKVCAGAATHFKDVIGCFAGCNLFYQRSAAKQKAPARGIINFRVEAVETLYSGGRVGG